METLRKVMIAKDQYDYWSAYMEDGREMLCPKSSFKDICSEVCPFFAIDGDYLHLLCCGSMYMMKIITESNVDSK